MVGSTLEKNENLRATSKKESDKRIVENSDGKDVINK